VGDTNTEQTQGQEEGTSQEIQTQEGTQEESSGAGEQTGGEESSSVETDDSANEYSPNYKFKVMDAEHEFDEWVRQSIKDVGTEKKARELYEKAYGLDHLKPKHEKLKADHSNLNDTWTNVKTDLEKVGHFLKEKDLGAFFNSFQLTDEDVLKYALDRVSYYELPPEKRQQLDMQNQKNLELYSLRQKVAQLEGWRNQTSTNQLDQQLTQVTNSPNYTSIAQQFEARVGQPGAFKKAVAQHALMQFQMTGKDLEPHEAVDSFIKIFGMAQTSSQGNGQQMTGKSPVHTSERAATFPKISGNGTSVVKKKYTSIDAIKKRYNELANS